MAIIKILDSGSLESICKILGETNDGLSGTEIGKYLAECHILTFNRISPNGNVYTKL